MIDLGRLPRYDFTDPFPRQGCKEHNRPECLCDVVLEGLEPVKILPRQRLMFHKLALRAIGATNVSERNFVDYAGVLLACYDRYRDMPDTPLLPEYDEGFDPNHLYGSDLERLQAHRERNRKPETGRTPWSALPKKVRSQLMWYARQNMPWTSASSLIPGYVPEDVIPYIRKNYVSKRGLYAKQRREDHAD